MFEDSFLQEFLDRYSEKGLIDYSIILPLDNICNVYCSNEENFKKMRYNINLCFEIIKVDASIFKISFCIQRVYKTQVIIK